MAKQDIECRYCGGINVIFKGKQNGHQVCRCKDCNRNFQLSYSYNAYKPEVREQIEKLAHNGSGTRDTARVLGISKNTVTANLKKTVKYVNEAFISRLPDSTEKEQLKQLEIEVCISAEADEQWSYVGSKKNPCWLWYLIEKKSRKVLAFTFGRRKDTVYRKLISLLPHHLIDSLHTDDWGAYTRVPFAPIHKIGKKGTQRIERKNLDLRTRVKRLARKTICYSKSQAVHEAIIGRFINLYMF